ncbi:MAG: BglG family transcription antiterminator [Lachnospiraceae bacterium]
MKHIQIMMLLTNLKQANNPIGAEECAGLLGMSVSTLKKDIIELKPMLKQHGCAIIGKRGQGNGYELNVFADGEFVRYMETILPKQIADDNMDLNEQKNRVRFLVERFLEQTDYLRAEALADELSISRSQFNKDFVLVKKIFEKFEIKLLNKPHYGMKTEASEKMIRICLASIYMQNWGLSEEHEIFFQPDSYSDSLTTIKEIVVNCAKQHHYKLTDTLIQNLVVHLYVAVKRLHAGHRMQLDTQTRDKLLENKEREIAATISEYVGRAFHVEFDDEELCYIIMHLTAKRVLDDDYLLNEKVMEIVDQMLMRIKESYFIDLTNDLDLRISLGMHTIPLIKRIQYGMTLRNPMLDEIKKKLVYAYEVALCGCGVINELFECTLSADEVGYYAMALKVAMDGLREPVQKKILLVCSSGRGSAQLLKSDFVKKYEKQLARLDTCNVFELEKVDLSDYDCIFTTVPLRLPFPIPIFKIKLFLDAESKRVIDRALKNNRQSEIIEHYFAEDLFFSHVGGDNKQEVIEQIVNQIAEHRILPDGFLQAVIAREQLEPTQLSPFVAMPHPDRVLTNSDIISLNILEKPVKWGDGEIQIVLLCSFSKGFVKHNELFFQFVMEFIRQRQHLTKLVKQPMYETVKTIIRNVCREVF